MTLGRYLGIVLVLCLALPACQKADKRVTKANFELIKPGMTRAELDTMLGKGDDEPSTQLLEGSGVAAGMGGVVDTTSALSGGGGTPALKWTMWGTDKVHILVCFNRSGKVHDTEFKKSAGLK